MRNEEVGIKKNHTLLSSPSSSLFPSLIFIAAYTLLSSVAVFFLIRGMGAVAGLFLGKDNVIVGALSQLAAARVSVPVWIPVCVAVAVCIFRALCIKRSGGKSAAVTAVSVVVLLSAFVAAFLLTRVNGVFVHVAIGIIRMLLGSGMF
jgi:hypothetical protein